MIAETVEAGWCAHTKAVKDRPSGGPRSYVYASGWRACNRAMALDLIHPEDRTFSGDAFERFYDGDDYEENCRARLIKAGRLADPSFRVVGSQERVELHDRSGRVVIVGKQDGRVEFEDRFGKPIFEIKSGVSVQRVDSFDDFKWSPWTRPMPYQLLSYLLALGEPAGFFILNRPGLPKFIDVRLEDHLDMAESFLQDAATAVDCLEGAPLPPFTEDRGECRRCDHYGQSCAPPVDFGAGVQMITDEVIVNNVRIRHENKDAAKAYERAHNALKESLRGVEYAIIGGEFQLIGKWQKLTSYPVPDRIKQEFKTVKEQGKFLLDIEPLPE